MTGEAKLIVVAGEASGDRAGAGVVRALRDDPRVSSLGFGGTALAHEGTRLVGHLRGTTAVGLTAPLRSARELGRVFRALVSAARDERPNVALLVNYTELNMRLARELRPLGIRIVWYIAPQIWAWREGRAKTLRGLVDRLCVILPFEEDLWRAKGVDTSYVGHPALETRGLARDDARTVLSLTSRAKTVAILPGSRPHEVRALLPAMLEAYERVRHDRASVDGRLLLAPSLDDATRAFAVDAAKRIALDTLEVDATAGIGRVLPAFDAALVASGTASLECAIAGVVPVVAYKVDLVTEAFARLLLKTPHVALPNVLLGRRAFDELVQRDVGPAPLAHALARALDDEVRKKACAEVVLALGDRHSPSSEVARIVRPYLFG